MIRNVRWVHTARDVTFRKISKSLSKNYFAAEKANILKLYLLNTINKMYFNLTTIYLFNLIIIENENMFIILIRTYYRCFHEFPMT